MWDFVLTCVLRGARSSRIIFMFALCFISICSESFWESIRLSIATVRGEEEKTDKPSTTQAEEADGADAVSGESLVQIAEDFKNISGEREHDGDRREEIIAEGAGEKDGVNVDYLEIQTAIILSDDERKTLWDEYKRYVDETVFIELRDATLCRYKILISVTFFSLGTCRLG